MQSPEYYKSEKFVWDNLKVQAGSGIVGLYETWKKEAKIRPFVISWPGETILDDDGLPLQGSCLLELPEDKEQWSPTIRKFINRTKAYALLLAEQVGKELRVILESHHGTRSWSIPILVSGDLRTLGTAAIQDNVHKIGILWRGKTASG